MSFRHAMLAAATLSFSAPVCAEDDADGMITVLAPHPGYRAVDGTTALGTDTPLLDTPQSVSVLTRQRLDDQALLSIADALRYVPGVTVGQGEGHRDQPTIRGNNSTADFFVDGLRDDVQYFRDFYNTERLEILKGPNALIFGRGGGGGVINRVAKTPQSDAFVAVDAATDTYGSVRAGADLNQPVVAGIAARLNGFYERSDSFRHFYELERFAVNPTIALQLGARGTIGLGYEYVRDDRVTDRGIPSQGGRPIRGFDKVFFGVPSINRSHFEAHVATVYGDYTLTPAVTLKARVVYGDYDKTYANIFAATAVAAGGGSVGLEAYRDPTSRRNLLGQTDLVWKVSTGGIDHVVLAGVEFGRQTTDNQRINGFFDAVANTTRTTVALGRILAVPPVFFRAGPGSRSVHTEAKSFAAYVQDQITLGEHIEIVAGIRYDRFTLDFGNRLTGAQFERSDRLWSPRLGLIFKPVANASLYVSYSRSYLPQSGDQFLSLDLTSAALEPEKFENYEAGAKWDITPRLAATAAIYRLDRTNTRAPGPIANTIVQTGAQRSKGVEFTLAGQLSDAWQTSIGYALQDAEIRVPTAAAPAGRKVAQVPRHQASLWNRYDFSNRIGAGIGVVHQSKSFASISNAVVLPSYTRVDAAVFVTLGRGFEAQVNVENLLGEDYYATAHNDNNISPGAPRSARFTVRKHF